MWISLAFLIPPLNYILDIFQVGAKIQCKFINQSSPLDGSKRWEIVGDVFRTLSLVELLELEHKYDRQYDLLVIFNVQHYPPHLQPSHPQLVTTSHIVTQPALR